MKVKPPRIRAATLRGGVEKNHPMEGRRMYSTMPVGASCAEAGS